MLKSQNSYVEKLNRIVITGDFKMNFKTNKLVATVLASTALMGFGSNALADSTDDIVNALMAKGVLTEEEGALLLKGRTGEKEAAEKKKESAIAASFKDGILFESGDKKHSMAVTGRVHFDYRDISGYDKNNDPDTASITDQFEVRRARIGVKGKFYDNIGYEIVTNAVGSSSNLIDTAFVNLGWWKPVQFQFGRFKQPMSLEELTSSNNITFTERSFVNALVPTKKLGAMVHGEPTDGLVYGVSVFQNGFSETNNEDDGKFVGGRVAANIAKFANWQDSVLHVGVSGYDGEWASKPVTTSQNSTSSTTRSTVFGFRTEGRGLSNVFRAQISGDNALATPGGTATNEATIDQRAYGLELAGSYGPFKLQGEYVKANYDAEYASAVALDSAQVKGDVDAYYAAISWMITGEKYADFYKGGAWGGVKPAMPFDVETGKGKGAFELAVRYSKFDASDVKVVDAGRGARLQGSDEADAYTLGANWYLNNNLRFMLDYVYTDYDTAFSPIDSGLAAEDNEKSIVLRGQFAF
jgi:phosphate-selective porin OprO and OprP